MAILGGSGERRAESDERIVRGQELEDRGDLDGAEKLFRQALELAPGYARALETFVRAASGGSFDGPGVLDGLRNLAVIDAAERAAASGASEAPAWSEPKPSTPSAFATR